MSQLWSFYFCYGLENMGHCQQNLETDRIQKPELTMLIVKASEINPSWMQTFEKLLWHQVEVILSKTAVDQGP